jgi:hypothetical protein
MHTTQPVHAKILILLNAHKAVVLKKRLSVVYVSQRHRQEHEAAEAHVFNECGVEDCVLVRHFIE